MRKNIVDKLRNYPKNYLTDTELFILLDGTTDSRYSKVKRLVADGNLIHIRRGLYCISENLRFAEKIHPFELSNLIYSPSYVSLESALAFHQLIPEAVYTITCATTKRSKQFKTPFVIFNYDKLPTNNFLTEVNIVLGGEKKNFMARPWKAICDYIYIHKKNGKILTLF